MHIGRWCLSLKIHANIIFSLLAVTDLLTFSGCVYRNSYQQLSPFWTTTPFDREYIQFCQINQISHISHFSPRSASTVSVARSKQREEKLPLCATDTAALISDSLKHQSSLIFVFDSSTHPLYQSFQLLIWILTLHEFVKSLGSTLLLGIWSAEQTLALRKSIVDKTAGEKRTCWASLQVRSYKSEGERGTLW